MILLDATAFALLINPKASPPIDPATGLAVVRAGDRFAFLQRQTESDGETIVIPTPALAEVLVSLEDQGPAVLERIGRSARFKIAPFDTMAAAEVAAMTRDAIRAGNKRAGSDAPWQKVKIDRQIIAIARTQGAERIYSDDQNLGSFAERLKMTVVRTWEMPLPPEDPQGSFGFPDE